MEKIQVVITTPFAEGIHAFNAGEICSVTPAVAERWIRLGIASKVEGEDTEPECAVTGPSESATLHHPPMRRPRRKRRK